MGLAFVYKSPVSMLPAISARDKVNKIKETYHRKRPKLHDSSIVEPLYLSPEKPFDAGTHPSDWTRPNVAPIHTRGSRQNKTKYRPVSLSASFLLVIEKIMLIS